MVMHKSKYLRLFKVLDEEKFQVADLTELLTQRAQLLPVMEEKLASLLRKSPNDRETIMRNFSFKSEKEPYQLIGYDPITKMVFLKEVRCTTICIPVEIERLLFHEYEFETSN